MQVSCVFSSVLAIPVHAVGGCTGKMKNDISYNIHYLVTETLKLETTEIPCLKCIRTPKKKRGGKHKKPGETVDALTIYLNKWFSRFHFMLAVEVV